MSDPIYPPAGFPWPPDGVDDRLDWSRLIPPPGCYSDLAGTKPCVGGDPVALWVSPNGLVMTQPDVAKRPTCRGGRPAFDAVDDSLLPTGLPPAPPPDEPHVVG